MLNATVAAAAGVAALTFAVMIGTFYLAEQYLQKTVITRRWAPARCWWSWRCSSAPPRRWPAAWSTVAASACPTVLGFLGAGLGHGDPGDPRGLARTGSAPALR